MPIETQLINIYVNKYLLSPQDAAFPIASQIAISVSRFLWFLIWNNSCPTSFMWVDIDIKNPAENPISIYPSPYHL